MHVKIYLNSIALEKNEKLELFGQFGMKGANTEGKEDCSMQVSQLSFVGVIFRLHWKFQKEKDFFSFGGFKLVVKLKIWF